MKKTQNSGITNQIIGGNSQTKLVEYSLHKPFSFQITLSNVMSISVHTVFN